MNPKFIEEVYLRDILKRRGRDYLEKAKEIAKDFEIIELSDNQINGLENTALSAKNVDDILKFLANKMKKSKKGQGWRKEKNGKTLSEALSEFIKNQICTDGQNIRSINQDISISESDLNNFINTTQIRLTREFIKHLSGWCKILKAYKEDINV